MKRSTLILSILLVLSVSANLAVAGMMAGHWLRGGGPSGGSPGGDRLLGLVPDDLRDPIHQSLRQHNPELRAQVEALRQARRGVAEALRQRPFDPARADEALARLRAETTHGQEKFHRTIVDRMAAAQADGQLRPPPERGRDKPKGGPPDGPR